MDVAALPSRGTSLQTAAESGAATPRHSRVPAARVTAKGCPAWGERVQGSPRGEYLLK